VTYASRTSCTACPGSTRQHCTCLRCTSRSLSCLFPLKPLPGMPLFSHVAVRSRAAARSLVAVASKRSQPGAVSLVSLVSLVAKLAQSASPAAWTDTWTDTDTGPTQLTLPPRRLPPRLVPASKESFTARHLRLAESLPTPPGLHTHTTAHTHTHTHTHTHNHTHSPGRPRQCYVATSCASHVPVSRYNGCITERRRRTPTATLASACMSVFIARTVSRRGWPP
jgi:hypothetical protein